jgi:hypothetical protein
VRLADPRLGDARWSPDAATVPAVRLPHVRRPARSALPAVLLTLVLGATAAGCADDGDDAGNASGTPSSAPSATRTTEAAATTDAASPSATTSAPPPKIEHVVAISVDGLNPTALTQLGAARVPAFWRLFREGASTLNARTDVERTDTLPNHTSMLTGRRVDKDHGGHGVFFNDTVTGTIAEQTGVASASVFDVLADAGRTSSLFASKTKFEVFDRSWPSITVYHDDADNNMLAEAAVTDLTDKEPAFSFIHLSAPDVAGHAHTWMSPQYLAAVEDADANVGRIMDAIESDDDLVDDTVLLVTADHGGNPHVGLHTIPTDPDNYTIPFLAWGAGVPAGVDLYSLNPRRHDPGKVQPPYGPGGPIRNGDIANTALDLLGLPAVPGSEFGREDPVQVR